jgi:hypothetical protein
VDFLQPPSTADTNAMNTARIWNARLLRMT